MDRNFYAAQMRRLAETYGERAYPAERMALLWNAFQNESNEVFLEAVSELIVTQRSMPMLKEFDAAVEVARRRANDAARGFGSFASVLNDAAKNNKLARPDVVKACMAALDWKMKTRTHHTDPKWEEAMRFVDALARDPQ